MKLSFVYPTFTAVENQPNIKAVAENYGVFPPLSLAYAAGIADSLNEHEIQFIDGNALNLSSEEVLEKLNKFSPDMVFLTITTYMFHENMSWIRHIKEHTTAKIIVGGAHLTLYPRETLSYKEIDIALMGEAEDTLPELLDVLKTKSTLKDIKGIGFRDNDNIIINLPRPQRRDINNLPFPARKYLPNHLYYSLISQKKNFTSIMTSRGCPYRCGFCEQRTSNFRGRSSEDVVKELRECYNDYGVREFEIFDPLFTTNKNRVIDLCKEIVNSGLKFDWSVRSRVDRVDDELLRWMSKANCKRIYFGIESGNEEVLKNLKKDFSVQDVREAITLTKKHNIDRFGYFMIGCPGETPETVMDTIKLAKSLDLTYAQFSSFCILPGTDLYEEWKKVNGYDYWREYILDRSKRRVMPLLRCNFTQKEQEYWIKKAYYRFYYRPKFMIKSLARIKSFEELKRSAKAAIEMVVS